MYGELKVKDEWTERRERCMKEPDCLAASEELIEYVKKVDWLRQDELDAFEDWKDKNQLELEKLDCSTGIREVIYYLNTYTYSTLVRQSAEFLLKSDCTKLATSLVGFLNASECPLLADEFNTNYASADSVKCQSVLGQLVGLLKRSDKRHLVDDHIDFWNSFDCPTIGEEIFSYLFIMFYMFIGNILLINMLIAMFA